MTSSGPLAGLRPDHAGISVADLEASIAWYGDMLGFTVDRIVDIPEDTGRLALIRNGDFLLELFCVPGAAPLPEERRHPATDLRTQGIKHVAYAVADISGSDGAPQGQGRGRRLGRGRARRHAVRVRPGQLRQLVEFVER